MYTVSISLYKPAEVMFQELGGLGIGEPIPEKDVTIKAISVELYDHLQNVGKWVAKLQAARWRVVVDQDTLLCEKQDVMTAEQAHQELKQLGLDSIDEIQLL